MAAYTFITLFVLAVLWSGGQRGASGDDADDVCTKGVANLKEMFTTFKQSGLIKTDISYILDFEPADDLCGVSQNLVDIVHAVSDLLDGSLFDQLGTYTYLSYAVINKVSVCIEGAESCGFCSALTDGAPPADPDMDPAQYRTDYADDAHNKIGRIITNGTNGEGYKKAYEYGTSQWCVCDAADSIGIRVLGVDSKEYLGYTFLNVLELLGGVGNSYKENYGYEMNKCVLKFANKILKNNGYGGQNVKNYERFTVPVKINCSGDDAPWAEKNIPPPIADMGTNGGGSAGLNLGVSVGGGFSLGAGVNFG